MNNCHKKTIFSSIFIMAQAGLLLASPAFAATDYIVKVDQLGYANKAKKTAVISTLAAGGVSLPTTLKLRRLSTSTSVGSASVVLWKNAQNTELHAQSGDKGGYVDFSGIETTGTYYFTDSGSTRLSANFKIGNDVYTAPVKNALRTYYYQRLGQAKNMAGEPATLVDANPAYVGHHQDGFATDVSSSATMESARTKKDLSGGWMDAGDPNKYSFYAGVTVIKLLDAYRKAPWAFDGAANIPESNNNLADLLDETKWQLAFMKRMQNATDTDGFVSRVGLYRNNLDADNSNARLLGADKNPRYYVGECPYATISGAAALAAAGTVFRTAPDHKFYGDELVDRAKRAWERYEYLRTQDPKGIDESCDSDNRLLSGGGAATADTQKRLAVMAAVYLYEAFKTSTYKDFVDNNYAAVMGKTGFGPELNFYNDLVEAALVHYSKLPGVVASVRQDIQTLKLNRVLALPALSTDLYRAPMQDRWYIHGGAGYHVAHALALLDVSELDSAVATSAQVTAASDGALDHAHWVHGVNPLSSVMLTQMATLGATNFVSEMYHMWFGGLGDVCTSPSGTGCLLPPPAYFVPGPCTPATNANGNANGCFSGGALQRNFSAQQRSWLSHEPSIFVQSGYVALMSRLQKGTELVAPGAPTGLKAPLKEPYSVNLTWAPSADAKAGYNVYATASGQAAELKAINVRVVAGSSAAGVRVQGLVCGTSYTFAVESVDQAGNKSASKPSIVASTAACVATAPAAVTEALVSAISDTTATLTWATTTTTKLGYFDIVQNNRVVQRLGADARSANLTGLNCGVANAVTIRAVHPQDVLTSSTTVPAFTTAACDASVIFKQDQLAYFWSAEGSWSIGPNGQKFSGATGSSPASFDVDVLPGGAISFSRWSDGNRTIALSTATTVGSNTHLNPSTARLVFDVTAVKSDALSSQTIELHPKIYFGQQGVPGTTALQLSAPEVLTLGMAKNVSISLQSMIGSQGPFDYLDRVDLISQADRGALFKISNLRIVH